MVAQHIYSLPPYLAIDFTTQAAFIYTTNTLLVSLCVVLLLMVLFS
jgi:hypothetical protein